MTTSAPTTAKPRVCDCGQELDGCSREHCPRCGVQLGRAA